MRNMFWKNALLICVWQAEIYFLFPRCFKTASPFPSHQLFFSSVCVFEWWFMEIFCCYCCQAFDQQQQDLVDAASKALSYRQDIIEENIRLSYALQVLILLYLVCIDPFRRRNLLGSFCFCKQRLRANLVMLFKSVSRLKILTCFQEKKRRLIIF